MRQAIGLVQLGVGVSLFFTPGCQQLLGNEARTLQVDALGARDASDDGPQVISPCAQDMALVQNAFCMDRWEASQSATAVGVAVSAPNKDAWTALDHRSASLACVSAGKRLCSIAEFSLACGGAAQTLYPYGNDYNKKGCYGDDATATEFGATGSNPTCQTADGIFDLKGNYQEWLADCAEEDRGLGPERKCAYESSWLRSSASVMQCGGAAILTTSPDWTNSPLGFRCCADRK